MYTPNAKPFSAILAAYTRQIRMQVEKGFTWKAKHSSLRIMLDIFEANHCTRCTHVACAWALWLHIMRFVVLNSSENWNFAGVLDIYLRRIPSKLVAVCVGAQRLLSKSCPYIKTASQAKPKQSIRTFRLAKVSILLLISFQCTSTWITTTVLH